MDKKGQGAMEYLVTHAWALLVIVTVGLLLWKLGVFDLFRAQSATGFSGGIKLLSWSVNSNGTAHLTFVNLERADMTLDSTAGAAKCGTINSTLPAQSYPFDKEFQVTLNCSSGGAGKAYALYVSVPYSTKLGNTNLNYKSSGTIKGTYE